MEAPELKRDIVFNTWLRGKPFAFSSTWGLFSPRHIDEGSQMLIESLEVRAHHKSLDLGCGYGAIGITVARECPQGQVHMVDKDFVALEYARKNAQLNGLANCLVYQSNAFSEVTESGFDNIMSNLPAQVGKQLLYIILSDARDRLKPGGRLYVVTVAHLRKFIRRNFEEVFGNYEKVRQGKTYTVAMAVKA